MPGNEVGDRVHNFFALDDLSQGQHSQVVGGNWPSDNSLWVGSQKQVGDPSSNPKFYNPQQSEIELGHSSHIPAPHGFNFMQTTARPEFIKLQSQSQQHNLNGHMYGRHAFLTRSDEANLLGLDTDSGQHNVNQRGFLAHESQQEGVSEQISKNPNRSDAFDAHGSLDLFRGQHQMNSQHRGLLQPLQQQQSGFSDIQHLQRKLMLRKMQELQRQKDMRQLDTRQQNSVNQASPFARQASGSHSHRLINGTPTSELSWAELATGNTNWLQHTSPAMQGSSSGLVLSPEQGQAQRSTGFVHQQVDQSLYGVPVSSPRGLLNPHASNQQMPTYGNSFLGNQYAGIPEQVIMQDGTSVGRQSLPGKSFFGHTSGQGSNSGINMEQIQQLTSMQQIRSKKEFQGPRDLIGPSEIVQDKPAIEVTSLHGAASLDPDEEKILFGSDENIWDAFGSNRNMGGGASNLLDDGEFASGLPSIQSGSWSALMQSAVAETSGGGIGVQEEWTGLDFQNPEHPWGRCPPTYEGNGQQQTVLADVNLPNASAMSHGVDGAKMKDKYHSNMGFKHQDKENPYEHDERPHANSSGQMNQHSSGGSKWLNRGPLQKVDAEVSRLYGNASNSESGEMNAKSILGHWTSQQYGNSLPNNKQNDWNPVDSVTPPGDTSVNVNESDNSLQHSQSNNRKRVMHEIGHGNGIWSANALPNSNVDLEPVNTSVGSPQINREGFTANSANLSNIQGGSHFGQFPSNSHHLNYWKHVESSVKSKGENLRKSQRHLNKGSQVSESSFNSSDKEDLKMHEMESSSKRENSNDSYQSSPSHQATTVRLRGNLSNQAGRKTSAPWKFQYHPMGNLDEDVEMSYGTRQGNNMQTMSLQHFRGLRGQDQGNLGHTKTNGQVHKSSAEVGKGHVPDLEGITKGSYDMRSKGMIGGHVPNMFAPFDRSVGLSTSEKACQPSQNMLELFHKVDQSRDSGTVRHFNSSERNLSSEMPEPEYSDGSLGGLQRSQSSNSQGFGLQLGPPSQRLALPNNTSNSQVSASLRDKGQAMLPSLPPSQETSHGEFKNNRISSSEQNASETSVHKMMANLSSSLGAGFPNSRSQLQNHQMVGARGLTLTNNSDNESFNRHAPQIRQTDETCNGPLSIQSEEGCLPYKASCGRYNDAASSHERVQALQTSGGEKLLASLSQTSSGMSQHGGFSKLLPNEWTNLPTQQHPFATQARREHSNHCQSSQLNIVESTSSGLQNLEDQEAEKRGNIFPNFATSSLNSQGLASLGEQSTKDSLSQTVLSGKVDRAQMTNGPLGKESVIKPLSDALSVNTTASQMDLEAFGRSLKPNNFHQNYSLMNQMRTMKNMDNHQYNRVTKKLKGSDNFLDGQQVASWPGQPNEHNDMVRDVSTCSTAVSPGDSQMLNFSGPADNVEQNVPFQPGYVCSKDMLASGQNESQSSVPSNVMTSVRAEHSHISPQMAPSWFDQYGTSKNGQLLQQRVDTVKSIEQAFSVGRLFGGLETHNSKEQASSPADTSHVGVIRKNPAPPLLALEQFSPPLPTDVSAQNLVTVRPKKRRLATANLHPWFVEVSRSFKNLQGICTGAVEWSTAANRLMEKVDDDGEVIEDVLPMPRPKRRLILTTLLMQQLLRAPPAAILLEASSNHESVVYYAARLALGDACNLVCSARSYSSISDSGANCLSDKSKQSERIDDHPLSKVMEDLMCKAGKLEDVFLRLDKGTSVLDLRVDCQDLERFSVINRFARFHGRGQADVVENSSSEAAAHALKPCPQRYVTAVALPANLPERVQCLSL